ncbi:hypothetical protein PHMEG_0005539 [Phytophthora megakarya]|uniref:Uncharacterized protein n=1 Tax=Phytophthora megakarya TaxID=4795 RepID=A0A225WR97_9STRA|nr:hypothetical protein PHMEG_0005539 [Phytophthora megakarya]
MYVKYISHAYLTVFRQPTTSLSNLKPVNTKRAQTTALVAFERYLASEGTSTAHVRTLIVADPARAGAMLVTIMDKFGVHQSPFRREADVSTFGSVVLPPSQVLAHGSVSTALRSSREAALEQGRTLVQHCIKRESVGFTKQAFPCTKNDNKKMIIASTLTGYQDVGLLCLLWYLFGRASDATFVHMQQLSRYAGNVASIISLFPDEDYVTCPLLALALALITQGAPCAALLNHLPDEVKSAPLEVSNSIPLLELLGDSLKPPTQSSVSTPATPKRMYAPSSIGIHAQVNRLLDRVSRSAGVETSLGSHSFRRGGARHTNASSELTAQWIFDREA